MTVLKDSKNSREIMKSFEFSSLPRSHFARQARLNRSNLKLIKCFKWAFLTLITALEDNRHDLSKFAAS